jgi:hypothetical protein
MRNRYFNSRTESQMRIAVSATSISDTSEAIKFLLADVSPSGHALPDFLCIHYSSNHDAGVLQDALDRFCRGRAFMGASSCLGVMTDTSLFIGEEGGIGLFAVWDTEADCGSASGELGPDPATDARNIASLALDRAGRPGEMPDLIWLSSAPGHEEEVLAGIKSLFGERALIVGGSSADNQVAGNWTQFGPDGVCRQGLAVSVLFSSGVVSSAYHSGYIETGNKGKITRIEGRRLYEIDGQPAADVYTKWTGLNLPKPQGAAPVPILAETTFNPLGHKSGTIASLPFYLLVHPAAIWPDGSLDLFAELANNEEVWSMHGTPDSLIARGGRLTELVISSLSTQNVGINGALIVYCGGCMLGVRDQMDRVREEIIRQMRGRPFLGVFTFGEQGQVRAGAAQHANLMISCTGFGSRQ